MRNRTKIIELVGIQWAWKSTILEEIKIKYKHNKNIFILDQSTHDCLYTKKNVFVKIMWRILSICKYPLENIYFFYLAVKSKNRKMIAFNALSYRLYILDKIKHYNIIITDEFYLHCLYRVMMQGDFSIKDSLLKKYLSFLPCIYPVFLNVNIELAMARSKNRGATYFDTLSEEKKKKLYSKNAYLAKHIAKIYCIVFWVKYRYIDASKSIEKTYNKVAKSVDDIV